MIANQLVYSIMIIIVIATTVNGNCPEDKKTYPIVTITNTSVNATPGMNLQNCCTVYIHQNTNDFGFGQNQFSYNLL